MRRIATALLALAALSMAAPMGAFAQAKTPFDKDALARGAKEAPAAVQKAGLPCTVTDAAYVGSSNGKDGSQNVYEVACQQGMGYVVMSGKTTKAYDCLATAEQKTLACRLPENADPKQGLKPVIASSGVTCTPTGARYVGANATTTVYEVACQEGPGFILQAPVPGGTTTATIAVPCIQAPATMACTLTSKAQNEAFLTALVSKSGRTCQVSGSRYMGSDTTSGMAYYEVGCGAQPGFVIGATKAGGFDHVLTCGQAQNLAGGCTLTSATAVAEQQTADYTRAVKSAGFDCEVSKSRSIGMDSKHDVIVEVACSNRPDGVVALIPPTPGAPVELTDCIKATRYGSGGACQLTTPTALYARYTAALRAKGRMTCQVSGARYMARGASGTDFVEVACADGKPGYVLELTPSTQLSGAPLSCGQARASGLNCGLPTNAGG